MMAAKLMRHPDATRITAQDAMYSPTRGQLSGLPDARKSNANNIAACTERIPHRTPKSRRQRPVGKAGHCSCFPAGWSIPSGSRGDS